MEQEQLVYSKEAMKELKERSEGGFTHDDIRAWMAQYEYPQVVAKIINSAAVVKDRSNIPVEYIAHMYEVLCKGDLAKALRMTVKDCESLHSAKYYFGQWLSGGKLLDQLSLKSPERWSTSKGWIKGK